MERVIEKWTAVVGRYVGGGRNRRIQRRESDRKSDRERHSVCDSPGEVEGEHLGGGAWSEHLRAPASAGDGNHDDPTQHHSVDLGTAVKREEGRGWCIRQD